MPRIAIKIDFLLAFSLPLVKIPGEKELVFPNLIRSSELDVHPIHAGRHIIGPVKTGHAKNAKPLGLAQHFVNF